jgi:hypothetical protein
MLARQMQAFTFFTGQKKAKEEQGLAEWHKW